MLWFLTTSKKKSFKDGKLIENRWLELKFLIINNVDFIFDNCSKKLFSSILDSNKSKQLIILSIMLDSEQPNKSFRFWFFEVFKSCSKFFWLMKTIFLFIISDFTNSTDFEWFSNDLLKYPLDIIFITSL